MAWLDIESAVLDRLADLATTTATRLPADLSARLPLIRVRRLGGRDDYWQVSARVVVEVYATSREQVWQVAESAAVRLLASSFVAGGVAVEQATTVSANVEIPYPDTDVRTVVATYGVVARRAPALL